MQALKKIAGFYLKSLDATVRILGTWFITGLLIAALGAFLNALNWLFLGNFSPGPLHPWIGVILLPPILWIGVTAGGFTVPPLLQSAKKRRSERKETSENPVRDEV